MAGICDRSECPATALHDFVVHGQDFHFCGHHWAELSPTLRAGGSSWDVPVLGPSDERSSAGDDDRLRSGRRRSAARDR